VVPLAVFGGVSLVLASLRPDLAGPCWKHLFGMLVMVVMVIVSAVTGSLTRLVFWSPRPGVRVMVGLLIQAVAVFLTVLIAVFAPIVFAFMYGQAD
jgi:hypothetical protein